MSERPHGDLGAPGAPARGRSKGAFVACVTVCLAGLAAAFVASLARGIIPVPVTDALSILAFGRGEGLASTLVLDLRLPRFLVAALAGAGLAVVGCLLQAALRNDLADPGLLGVSPGAALVVAAVIVSGREAEPALLTLGAMAGGTLGGLTILLATRGTRDPVRMVLVGAALSALFQSATLFVLVIGSGPQVQAIYAYLAGSLTGRDWADAGRLLVALGFAAPIVLAATRTLNVLRLDEDVAAALGLNLPRSRLLALALAVALTAPIVAVAGPIGFVGLVGPHLARALLRTGDVVLVLPAAALIGALLLAGSDLVAREVVSPTELPVGLIATALGAPAAVAILRRVRSGPVT